MSWQNRQTENERNVYIPQKCHQHRSPLSFSRLCVNRLSNTTRAWCNDKSYEWVTQPHTIMSPWCMFLWGNSYRVLFVTVSLKTAFKINRRIKQNKNDMNIPSGKIETEFISERCGYVSMQESIEFPKANRSKKIRIKRQKTSTGNSE